MCNISKPIQHANVEWRNGQPFATDFQDVYFSSDNGLAETDYVFLQGNDLLNRWQSLTFNTFTIFETGFGTGLNFICAADLWLKTAPPAAVLQFYSVEKYPLTLQSITQALQNWPQLSTIYQPFLYEYPQLLQHQTVALFNGRVQLTLLIGDATEQLSSLSMNTDAWFLDGFAPRKNPAMWQPALFEQMARLSTPLCTFATFTSAGDVRRGLLQAGFDVKKQAGFGKKREMLQGKFVGIAHD
ncbi:MAG TPA: tRNA (5-methylaminomethyl-2-thiouridine)(34)-methyltransferase MnmD [Methylotenera sp.]|nr:tRNA (5-methylaminomethyl-2-thiouridine)(34)-methyltransferase MnmD [Methylotenera sp.]HPH04820.1 tRNA (5-methylaminomethyl-2-thiouridine)(34)-methyltransferase MnmD [Methylotenera sp.]HPN01730.1 tRNA (5-methylaminomethyl-2-thiouridine)(34)-methyltransferase MnmD [Methylotenera sp.]